ncbi:MAG: hypothetical protein OXG78_17525 [Chloroflexi bacterium]|nr:hypothetical protein [Chloroflexota bacterium]
MATNDQLTAPESAGSRANNEERLLALPQRIPAEWLAYAAVAMLSLWLRVTLLDTVPITDFEAKQSLHARHTLEDDAPGEFVSARSPLTYITQLLMFSLGGASEFNARIGTALAGFALALTPLLFRSSLGLTRTFLWTVLLSFLTVPLAASRAADGTSFMLLFTVLAVWMIRRYWYSQRMRDAAWASVFVTFMLLLSSPSGIPLFIILIASGWLAVWRTALSAPQRLELPGDDILQLAVKQLKVFPFARILAIPFFVAAVSATLFMLNPSGLRTISQLIETSSSGISSSASTDGIPLGFATLILQEPLLIVFACGGAWLLWKHGDVTYVDRFAAAWAALGTLGLMLYPGARASDALWVVLPLSLLASYGITQLIVNRRVMILRWRPDPDIDVEDEGMLYTTQFWWAKWAISAGVLLCLFVISVQFMQVARLLGSLPAGSSLGEVMTLLGEAPQLRLLQGLGLLIMTSIVSLILFLMVANFWGLGTCLQGTGIGFFWVLLISGLGGAWQATVHNAEIPDGLWREHAVARDAYLLRDTLYELADRETSGFPTVDIAIVTDDHGVVNDSGLLAWLVRDFPNARFENFAAAAAGERIVLMRDAEHEASDLASDYVGQRFILRRRSSLAKIDVWDMAAWWSQGRLDRSIIEDETVILWLRQDVYNGANPADRNQS